MSLAVAERYHTATSNSELICGWERVRIPQTCCGQEVVVGIDEAGRGPVLGSLIYVTAFWPMAQHEEICKLGYNDSKQLKEEDRERLFKGIQSHHSIGWVIEELTAETISKEMQRVNPVSLNAISYDAVIRALETIRDYGSNPPLVTEVYVDTVGDPEYYKSRLTKALGEDFAKFTIEKKADATYKVVSAASIIAKVTRDTSLKQFVYNEETMRHLDKNFGSGYPGDENCVNWLKRASHPVFGFPNIVRFSWSTSREALKKIEAAEVKFECDDEMGSGMDSISSHFSAAGQKRLKIKRTPFFLNKKMKYLLSDDL